MLVECFCPETFNFLEFDGIKNDMRRRCGLDCKILVLTFLKVVRRDGVTH